MQVSSETIYIIGLVLVGFSVLAAAIIVPVFLVAGFRLKKRLEEDYGENGQHGR
ncbi:MAG: hypothetical protein FWH57_00270 [Oscillospiraceae bacterium]|nr:hypothetical protein [Oscillospiraceae bacterium]